MVRNTIVLYLLILSSSCSFDKRRDDNILMYHNYYKSVPAPYGIVDVFKNITIDTISVSNLKGNRLGVIDNRLFRDFIFKQDSINKASNKMLYDDGFLNDTSNVSFEFYSVGKFSIHRDLISLLVFCKRISYKRLINGYDDSILLLTLKKGKLCSIVDVSDDKAFISGQSDTYYTRFVDCSYFVKERAQNLAKLDFLINENESSMIDKSWHKFKALFPKKKVVVFSSFCIDKNGYIKLIK
jgi:hypothetical protein